MGDLARPETIGIDRANRGDETAVAKVLTHKDGLLEIVWVKHGDEAAAILRALEAEGRG